GNRRGNRPDKTGSGVGKREEDICFASLVKARINLYDVTTSVKKAASLSLFFKIDEVLKDDDYTKGENILTY
ncbi:MAG TPA: hypothetical protein P5046_04190, partial [Sphaerochaeta sp.]|nr:hypothetical protein [Sphaerochaeta sp.]